MQTNKVFDLIETNDLQTLQQILIDGYDVNSADKDGYSLLHMAIDFDNERAVRLILSTKDCRVNCYTYAHRLTGLHFASQDGKNHLVSLLLDSGADIDCVDHNNCTPLYFAVSANHLSTVGLLLNRGANPNVKNSNAISPLLQAVSISKQMTQILVERNAEMSPFCRELHTSLLSNKAEVADLLLDIISSPLSANRIGRTPLQNAVQHITTDDPKQAVNLIRKMIEYG